MTSVDSQSVERDPAEDEVIHWAHEELGETLDELKLGIDEVLTEARRRLDERNHQPVGERSGVTPDAGGALLALLGKLPGVIGNSLSGDAERIAAARATLIGLDGRLRTGGIELGEELTSFADRLAGLRGQDRPVP